MLKVMTIATVIFIPLKAYVIEIILNINIF